MQFRKDINGLRAIAVIAVVIFHFQSALLPGGFAGVDVFFVISGFLMTGIIFKGLDDDSFSVWKFYLARANRIIPPLAVLCLFLVVAGYWLLATWDYKTLGRDIVGGITFLSNIVFSLRQGYFESGDNFLLHTWSLSAEWQFYIIYPILLILLKKFLSIANIKIIVLVGTVIGFIFSVYATPTWPNQSYYLLPMRAWEMMMGGVAFLYPIAIKESNKKIWEWSGALLIILSYIFISSSNLWPGHLALIPVLGAYLIIIANRQDSILTSNTAFQLLGKWSYSIYLWHWPIAVSFSYYGISGKYKILGIAISIFLGWLSYQYVERNSFIKKQTLIKSLILHAVIVILLSAAGAYIFASQGISQRVNLEENPLIQGGTGNNHKLEEGESLLNTDSEYDFLLIGDSNANHYVRGILHSGDKVKLSWYPTCISLPNAVNKRRGTYPNWKEKCQNNFKLGFDNDNIIIAHSWIKTDGNLACTTDNCTLTDIYYDDLASELDIMFKLYGKERNVFVISELPKPQNNAIMTCLKTRYLTNLAFSCDDIAESRENGKEINTVLKKVTEDFENVYFIDTRKSICEDDLCKFSKDNKSIFMTDGSHLSGFGSEFMWDFIMEEIKKIQDKR